MALLEELARTINRDIIHAPTSDAQPMSVLELVSRADAMPDRNMSLSGNLWVSALVNLCPRQIIILHRMSERPVRRHSSATRVAFAQGHGIHDHVTGQVIRAMEGRGVWGSWRCRCEHSSGLGFKPVNALPCERCQTKMVNYHEPYLVDRAHRISGRPDLVLGGDDLLHVVEVKSMAPAAFDKLTEAETDHVTQALIYRQMMLDLGYAMSDDVLIFYVRKQWHYRDSPYKEFRVDATTGLLRLRVADCYVRAQQVWDALENDTLPDRTICAMPTSPMARECPAAVRCFSL